MKLFKSIKKTKEQLIDNSLFDTTNHTNSYALRLYYVAFEPFRSYGLDKEKLGQTYTISSPFRLPKNMSIEDACKVKSYLSDEIEKENHLEPACEKSVIMVSNILENYGFRKVKEISDVYYHEVTTTRYDHLPESGANFDGINKIEGVVDLFTVGGDFDVFKNTKLHQNYFEWYSEEVSKQDIVDIYKKIKQSIISSNSNSDDEKC